MSHSEKYKNIKILTFFFCLSIITTVAFNNCGQSQSPSDLAFLSLDDLQEEYKVRVAGSFSADFCNNEEHYSCSERVFSPQAKNEKQKVNFDCVQVDQSHRFCVSGTSQSYNSGAAMHNCKDCSQEELKRYDYSEYTCFQNIAKLNNVHPIRFDSANLEEALSRAFEICHQVISGE